MEKSYSYGKNTIITEDGRVIRCITTDSNGNPVTGYPYRACYNRRSGRYEGYDNCVGIKYTTFRALLRNGKAIIA